MKTLIQYLITLFTFKPELSPTSIALIKAKELISAEENWTKHCIAKDKNGFPCTVNSPDAVAYCASGAIRKVSKPFVSALKAIKYLNKAAYPKTLIALNDSSSTSHEDVMEMFDKAIELSIKDTIKQ